MKNTDKRTTGLAWAKKGGRGGFVLDYSLLDESGKPLMRICDAEFRRREKEQKDIAMEEEMKRNREGVRGMDKEEVKQAVRDFHNQGEFDAKDYWGFLRD